ncbi:hypothetical protein FB45DRAFT_922724 [Roridomyces roridus]|uniref:Uncharacterized protein n=1 Tax=Roridomyces roridus TaxID=1738132 RepID=A0AAD7FIM0_9AGAR|nr:hypothetical protein FB45DRAFT_922724 [Roridomyces roridus]
MGWTKCAGYPSAEEYPLLPTVDLDSLVYFSDDVPPSTSFDLSPLRTRKLTLRKESPDVASRFLHRLGTHLTHLCLLHPDVPSAITFFHTTNLTHLEIHHAFALEYRITTAIYTEPQPLHISPHLQGVLARIAPRNPRLHTLILHAKTGFQRETLGRATFVTELLSLRGLEELAELRLDVLEDMFMDDRLEFLRTMLRAFVRGVNSASQTQVVGILRGKIIARSGEQ